MFIVKAMGLWLVFFLLRFVRAEWESASVHAPIHASNDDEFDRREREELSSILAHKETFSFRAWSPVRGHVHASVSVPLFSPFFDAVETSSTLCRELVDADDERESRYSSQDWLRCVLPAVQSLRWRRVQRFVERIQSRYEERAHDSVTYALFLAYERDEEQRAHEAALREELVLSAEGDALSASVSVSDEREIARRMRTETVCVLGDPTTHSLFPALSASPFVRRVLVFPTHSSALSLSARNNATSTDNVPFWSWREASAVAEYFDVDLQYIAVAQLLSTTLYLSNPETEKETETEKAWIHSCDVVQIQPDFYFFEKSEHCDNTHTAEACVKGDVAQTRTLIQRIVHHLSRKTPSDNEKRKTTRVIWVSHHGRAHSRTAQQLQHLVQWKLRSTWFLHSRISLTPDRNGFLQKVYAQSLTENLATVRVGYQADDNARKDRPKNKAKKPIVVLTSANRILLDNVLGLREKLHALGFAHVHALTDLSLSTLALLERQALRQRTWLLQISLAPSDVEIFLPHYIAFNVEQQWSNLAFGSGADRFYTILREAQAVWTFFPRNAQFLSNWLSKQQSSSSLSAGNDVCREEATDVFVVPFYYTNDRGREREQAWISSTISPQIFQPNEPRLLQHRFVLFFGSNSPRRTQLMQSLHERCAASRVLLESGTELLFVAGSWNVLFFDSEKDFYVRRASAVLNLQQENSSVLEEHRLRYLLAFNKLVISERGSDANEENATWLNYKEGVEFISSVDEIVHRLEEFFGSQNEKGHQSAVIVEKEERARRTFEALNKNITSLSLAMKSVVQRLVSSNDDHDKDFCSY